MADFCHEYDPGGLGCTQPGPCPPDCGGDFHQYAVELAPQLDPGDMVVIGICEGHGCRVTLSRFAEGVCMDHIEYVPDEGTAAPVRVWVTKTEAPGGP